MEMNKIRNQIKKISRRTQIPNEQIQTRKERDLPDSRRMRSKGIDREGSLVLILRSLFDLHMFGKKNPILFGS